MRLKILVVTNRPPDPRGTGDAKVAQEVIESFANAGHKVVNLQLHRPGLSRTCVQIVAALLRGEPLQFGLVRSAALRKTLERHDGERADVVAAVHIRVAFQIPAELRPRAVALIIDSYGLSYETYQRVASWPARLLYRWEARRMVRQERIVCSEFARTVVLSKADQRFLRRHSIWPERIVRLPYAVDIEYFSATARVPDPTRPVLLFIGRLGYFPNRDAVRELITRVWPRIKKERPNAVLRVVGAHPERSTLELARRHGVQVEANVPDVRIALGSATAMVVPMRVGGGIQSKILEAMAARVPIICSAFANEGIGALPGYHLLIANTPAEFAIQVRRLTSETHLASNLTEAARTWVEEEHAPNRFRDGLLRLCDALLAPGGQQPERPKEDGEAGAMPF